MSVLSHGAAAAWKIFLPFFTRDIFHSTTTSKELRVHADHCIIKRTYTAARIWNCITHKAVHVDLQPCCTEWGDGGVWINYVRPSEWASERERSLLRLMTAQDTHRDVWDTYVDISTEKTFCLYECRRVSELSDATLTSSGIYTRTQIWIEHND